MSLESRTAPNGDAVYVDRSAGDRGADAPFYIAYLSPDCERRWGYLCGNCDSFDNAMDAMGRIECNACGNYRKPDRWDAAHE
ncbi:MAG: DUF5816 domain-containing protein [Haloplanus sp.]